MAKQRVPRHLDLAFKRKAVRRIEDPRAVQVPLTTFERSRGPAQLRMWADQLAAQAGRLLTDVFSGEWRLSNHAGEIQRLQRENQTLRKEHDFLRRRR